MAPEQATSSAYHADDGARLRGRTILLLEDEIVIAFDLADAMEAAGATVVHANGVARGLAAIRAHGFDGAVLDVNLGRGETCAEVAKSLRAEGVPFLLHTGDLVRVGEVVSSIEAPIMPKPAETSKLIERLAALIEG